MASSILCIFGCRPAHNRAARQCEATDVSHGSVSMVTGEKPRPSSRLDAEKVPAYYLLCFRSIHARILLKLRYVNHRFQKIEAFKVFFLWHLSTCFFCYVLAQWKCVTVVKMAVKLWMVVAMASVDSWVGDTNLALTHPW